MNEFENKAVVVSGTAGVLGEAVGRAFHEAGATVIGIDVVAHSAPFKTLELDLLDLNKTKRAMEALRSIHVLANIAGGFTMGESVAETSDETWDYMMNLNVRTMLNLVRAVVPLMRTSGVGGKIVNVGAHGALQGSALMAPYVAAKSVVIRTTESLAAELKQDGINVNCVLPSIIDTERNRQDMPNADFSKWVPPAALAQIVLFLASASADPIHGAALPVTGLV
ncbi:MAG: SDR family NAD(P)-dependent oxidoreductase [Gammaproteobacteria bacterium]|nr:SDR family NAD(P)-dependent oxidoreductase [Gammaproteobacteria bacterium]